MKKYILLFLVFLSSMFAQKGFVTYYEKETADQLIASLIHLRYNLETKMPIEIWFQDVEMDKKHAEAISHFKNVRLCPYSGEPTNRNFAILGLTQFSEIIWFDPEVIFLISPEVLFDDPHYLETGTYFFKQLFYLPKRIRKSEAKKNIQLVKAIEREIYPYLEKIPYYITSKILRKPGIFTSRFHPVFSDEKFFAYHLETNKKALACLENYTKHPELCQLNLSDLLWIATVVTGGNIHLNFVKQVGLIDSNQEDLASIHLYRGKVLALENLNLKQSESYELKEPISNVTRPLVDYEKEALPNLIQAFLFLM